MTKAKLHIICGNCGCNDKFKLMITRDGDDITIASPLFEDAAVVICQNCGTHHDLKDNAEDILMG